LRHADGISQGIDISKASPRDPYYLKPHQTLLVRTQETLRIPHDCAGIIRLKSSIAREGILLAGAEFFDPGFEGVATLSIFNAAALHFAIWPDRRFCQLILHQTKGEVHTPYQGKYQGATDVVGSLETFALGDR
jgi:dCTP deaminase